MTEGDYLELLRHTSRDNARTPMQWDSSSNAGFTTVPKPWLAVNPNFKTINATAEVNDPDSVYNYTAQIIALRKRTPALIYGDYEDIDREQKQMFAYLRTLGHDQYLIVQNFSSQPVEYSLPRGLVAGTLVADNYPDKESGATLHLMGWESRIYKQ
jgi:oligo-1,6-glucosidase